MQVEKKICASTARHKTARGLGKFKKRRDIGSGYLVKLDCYFFLSLIPLRVPSSHISNQYCKICNKHSFENKHYILAVLAHFFLLRLVKSPEIYGIKLSVILRFANFILLLTSKTYTGHQLLEVICILLEQLPTICLNLC
jgi:hypothetical protein